MGLLVNAPRTTMENPVGHSTKIATDSLKISAIAGQEIPAGALSPKITLGTPLDVSTVFWQDGDVDYVVEVTIQGDKLISTALNNNWMKHVRLSRHCHMQNLQIIANGGDLYLQSTRVIHKGENLFAWFTMETSKIFKIPFLTLNNIKGGLHYSCHQCAKVFEDPNPLKIHLAFLCPLTAEHSKDGPQLSSKTANSHQNDQEHGSKCRISSPFLPLSPSSGSNLRRPIFSTHSAFKPLRHNSKCTPLPSTPLAVRPTSTAAPATNVQSLSSSTGFVTFVDRPDRIRGPTSNGQVSTTGGTCPKFPMNCPSLQRFQQPVFPGNYLGLSYLQMAVTAERTTAGQFLGVTDTGPSRTVIRPGSSSGALTDADDQTTVTTSATADFFSLPNFVTTSRPSSVALTSAAVTRPNPDPIVVAGIVSEDFLSSDGRSKRRHKCFYCGKMYSRKYGLKIHIRTHTGYKPLKCKVCLRPFGDPSNLNKHIRLHAEGITPYRCELCGKVLVRRRDLERHLKSRHPCSQEGGEGRVQESTSVLLKDSNNDVTKK